MIRLTKFQLLFDYRQHCNRAAKQKFKPLNMTQFFNVVKNIKDQ